MTVAGFLTLSTVLLLSLPGMAGARPGQDDMALALADVIWDGAPPAAAVGRIRDAVIAEYPLLDAAVARGEPDYMDETLSAAILARSATHPATRRAMYDITRYLLAHAVEDAATNAILAEWQATDPVRAGVGLGVGLAASDIAAASVLEGMGFPPDHDTTTRMAAAWRDNAAFPPNQFILTRIDGWAAGVVANWAALSPEQRVEATGISWRDEVPSAATVRIVTGASDFVGWFAGIDLALTPAERAAHGELVAMAERGELAGAMAQLVARMPAGAYPMLDYDAFMMSFRLNSYLIGGGDMGDWQAGAAMWGLQ